MTDREKEETAFSCNLLLLNVEKKRQKSMSYKIDCIPEKKLADKTFFHPWIGKNYWFPEQNMFGKTKILILGQSHYCKNNPENSCHLNCGSMCLCSYLEADKSHISPDQIRRRKEQMGSEYGGQHCNDFTIKTIKAYAKTCETGQNPTWKQNFIQSEKYILGHQASKEQFSLFWNSVSFYNFVQTAYSDKAISYDNTYNALDLSKGMFQDVIAFLKPNVIIAWGLAAWSKQAKTALNTNQFSLQEGGAIYKKENDSQYYEKIEGLNYWQDVVTIKTENNREIFVLIPHHPASRCKKTKPEAFEKLSLKCSERIKQICQTMNPEKESEWKNQK